MWLSVTTSVLLTLSFTDLFNPKYKGGSTIIIPKANYAVTVRFLKHRENAHPPGQQEGCVCMLVCTVVAVATAATLPTGVGASEQQ